MKSRKIFEPVALLLLLFGCGGGSSTEAERAPKVQRIALTPLAPRGPSQTTSTIARFEIPKGLAPWAFVGTEPVFLDDDSGGLLLRGDGSKRVEIPGPIAVVGADALWVELASNARTAVSAHLLAADGKVRSTAMARLEGGAQPVRLRLAFKNPVPAGEYVRVVLSLKGIGPQALYGALEFERKPPGAWLPDPSDQDPLLNIRSEQRRGYGVAAGRPLGGSVQLPPDAVLRFASAPAPDADPALLDSAQLSVRVEAEGRPPIEHRFAISTDDRDSWSAGELSLAELGGTQAKVRFEIEAPEDSEATCLLSDVRVVEPDPDAPTVLLVTSDTHRADHVGVARNARAVRTPTMDALAARGVWFEDCSTSTNITNPSHMALLTGLHPRDHGVLGNDTAISERAETLAEHFAAAGFACMSSLSINHLAPDISGLGQGFHCVSSPAGHREALRTVAAMRRWMDEHEGEPVFCWLHLFDAHGPYAPPPRFAAEVWPIERDPFDPELPALELPERLFKHNLTGLRDLEYPLAMYRAEIASLDHELGKLLARPRVHAGIIAVTADHGESLGDHGIYYSHAELYPQSLHVPLILSWPGSPAGLRIETPVRQIDLGRTLLELAGIEPQMRDGLPFPGRSLLPLIRGEQQLETPRFALAANLSSASITVGGWHLILGLRSYEGSSLLYPLERHRVELYQLSADPECTRDLVDEQPERARRMRELLVEWLAVGPTEDLAGEVQTGEALRQQLAALGYAEAGAGGAQAMELLPEDCTCEWCVRFR